MTSLLVAVVYPGEPAQLAAGDMQQFIMYYDFVE
jgi:hypothetical protein